MKNQSLLLTLMATTSSTQLLRAENTWDSTRKKVEAYAEAQKAKAAASKELADTNALLSKLGKGTTKTWGKIESFTNATWKKAEAEYAKDTAAHKSTKPAEFVSPLNKEEKASAGVDVYATIAESFSKWKDDPKTTVTFDQARSTFETTLRESNLASADAGFVVDSKGNSLLQTLVQQAYVKEKAFAKTADDNAIEQLAEPKTAVKPLESDNSYQLTLSMIAYLSGETDMAKVANAKTQTPVQWVASQPQPSFNLIQVLISHDKNGVSRAQLKAMLDKKKADAAAASDNGPV